MQETVSWIHYITYNNEHAPLCENKQDSVSREKEISR